MADRRRSSEGDADAAKMSGQSNKKTPADTKWSFHFKRLYAIVILTFLISIFALLYDELSSAIKRVTDDDTNEWCKVEGRCGWSEGVYSYSVSDGGYSPAPCPPGQLGGKSEYTVNYGDYCNDRGDEEYNGQFDDTCIAMNAGNVWLAFSIISLISLLGLLIIFTSACLKKDVVVNEKIQKNVRIILIILFLITWISEFIAAFVWLVESICDEANVYYDELIVEDTANSFGVLSIF